MTVNEEAIDRAIQVLNRVHKTDPSVLNALIQFRVPCNDQLVEDPTVQVGLRPDTDDIYEVGLLGIINGLFGVDDRSIGYIVAVFGKEDGVMGQLLGFRRMNPDGDFTDD